jgi:hypothetical protein
MVRLRAKVIIDYKQEVGVDFSETFIKKFIPHPLAEKSQIVMTSFPAAKKISISEMVRVRAKHTIHYLKEFGVDIQSILLKRQACGLSSSVRPCGLIGTVLVNKRV